MKQRIALVAVSALTAGFLSVVAAPAANAALVGTATDGTIVAATGSLVCSATNDAGGELAAGDTRISSSAGFNIVMPIGATLLVALNANDNVEINGPVVASSLDADAVGDVLVMSINSKGRVLLDDPGNLGENFILTATALGTATLVVSADGASTTPSDVTTNSLDITVVASCANATMVAANSRVAFTGTDGAAVAITPTNVDVTTSASSGNSLYAQIYLKNAYGAAMTTGTLSVSATNGALVSLGNAIGTAHSAGTVSVATITTDGSDLLRVRPASYLTTSTTTLTITHNGAAVTTKTVTFRGEAATIEILATSAGKTSTATTGFFAYQYKDTAGNIVDGAAAAIDSSTVTAVVTTATSEKAPSSSASAVTGNLLDPIETAIGDTAAGVMSFTCSSTAGKSTVTIKHTNAISAASISKTVELSCFGGIDTYTVSTDKASYALGEIATITITAKDSKGNPAFGTATMGATDTVSVGGGTLTKAVAAADAFTNGVRTYKAQMTTAGTFNVVVSVTGDTTTSATTSYKVTNADAGVTNAQVLQSIVALIASINKQIQALQALILKKK
jgi:hypothetical protein